MLREQVSTIYTSSRNSLGTESSSRTTETWGPSKPAQGVYAATTSVSQRGKEKRDKRVGSGQKRGFAVVPTPPGFDSHPHLCLPRWTERSWTSHRLATRPLLCNVLGAQKPFGSRNNFEQKL